MKAVLKSYHSPDVYDLDTYRPKDPMAFEFLLQAFIGPDDGTDSSESFDIEVVTPIALSNSMSRDEVKSGRFLLIMREYNLKRIIDFIEKFCEGCTGESWGEVAEKVSRLGHWEFEDYKGDLPASPP